MNIVMRIPDVISTDGGKDKNERQFQNKEHKGA